MPSKPSATEERAPVASLSLRSLPRAPHRESVLELALKRGKALVLTAELSDPLRHGLFLAHDRRELEAAHNECGGVAIVATAFVGEDALGSLRGGQAPTGELRASSLLYLGEDKRERSPEHRVVSSPPACPRGRAPV